MNHPNLQPPINYPPIFKYPHNIDLNFGPCMLILVNFLFCHAHGHKVNDIDSFRYVWHG